MFRTTALAPFAALALLAPATSAQAAEEDTQLWFINTATTELDGAKVALEVTPRLRSNRAGEDQFVYRLTVDTDVAPKLSIGAGLGYFANSRVSEMRAHQQATLTLGQLSLRTRFEQRMFDNADRAALRLRERIQWTQPVLPRTKLILSAEAYYTARSQTPGAPSRFEQYWGIAGVQHAVSPRLSLGVGYLGILAPKTNAPDRFSHVPQVSLALKF